QRCAPALLKRATAASHHPSGSTRNARGARSAAAEHRASRPHHDRNHDGAPPRARAPRVHAGRCPSARGTRRGLTLLPSTASTANWKKRPDRSAEELVLRHTLGYSSARFERVTPSPQTLSSHPYTSRVNAYRFSIQQPSRMLADRG